MPATGRLARSVSRDARPLGRDASTDSVGNDVQESKRGPSLTWMAMRMPCTAGAHPLLAAMAASITFRTRGARWGMRAAIAAMSFLCELGGVS